MDFRKQISQFLGKAANRRWKDIASDIMAVIGGIKPVFLYDYSTCESKSLDKLVAEMESMTKCICGSRSRTKCETQEANNSPSPDGYSDSVANLVIRTTATLNIKDDVVVLNKEILIRQLKQFIFTMMSDATARSEQEKPIQQVCTLVDVSGNLSNPTMADKSITREIVKIAKDILTQIEAEFADPGRMSSDIPTLHLEDNWNVSTIFGLMIGYPVLYWYQVDIQDNCLAYTPLNVIKCTCNCMVKTKKCDSENVCKSCTTSLEIINHDHVMYSFSIPSILFEHAGKQIAEWKECIRRVVDLCEYFNFTSFECTTVTLPVVAL